MVHEGPPCSRLRRLRRRAGPVGRGGERRGIAGAFRGAAVEPRARRWRRGIGSRREAVGPVAALLTGAEPARDRALDGLGAALAASGSLSDRRAAVVLSAVGRNPCHPASGRSWVANPGGDRVHDGDRQSGILAGGGADGSSAPDQAARHRTLSRPGRGTPRRSGMAGCSPPAGGTATARRGWFDGASPEAAAVAHSRQLGCGQGSSPARSGKRGPAMKGDESGAERAENLHSSGGAKATRPVLVPSSMTSDNAILSDMKGRRQPRRFSHL